MIEERYCSYEVSNLFQEKGFNQECFAKYAKETCTERYYDDYRERMLSWTIKPGELIIPSIDRESYEVYGVMIPAPTHQMACDWIYEKYGLWIQVFLYVTLSKDKKEDNFTSKKIKWTFDIVTKFPEKGPYQYYEPIREEFDSQYEATEAGLKYILKRI